MAVASQSAMITGFSRPAEVAGAGKCSVVVKLRPSGANLSSFTTKYRLNFIIKDVDKRNFSAPNTRAAVEVQNTGKETGSHKSKEVLRVALIWGGPSEERGISLNSARSVLDHIQNDGKLFVPLYPSYLSQILGEWNLWAARGEIHKRMRAAVLRFISISVVKDRLMSEIQNIILSSLSGWGGRNVNVMHEAEEMIFSLMAHHIFSLSAGTELENLKRDFYILIKGLFSIPLKVPGTTFYKSLQKRQEVFNQIKGIVEERKKNMSSCDSYDDLLSSILKDGTEKQFTTEQIVDLIIQLVFAAIETTPKAMALVVQQLSKNPHIIPELREEHEAIKRTKENSESLSWDDYQSMVFTRSVIKETLRFGNPSLNNILFRRTIENVKLEGYTIPKGWPCIVYDFVSDMDNKYYTDPLAFNPRRWQGNEMNQVPYISFGGGPRLCLGYELAMLVISFFLHHLVTKFNWEYIPSKSRWFDSPFTSIPDCTIQVENR